MPRVRFEPMVPASARAKTIHSKARMSRLRVYHHPVIWKLSEWPSHKDKDGPCTERSESMVWKYSYIYTRLWRKRWQTLRTSLKRGYRGKFIYLMIRYTKYFISLYHHHQCHRITLVAIITRRLVTAYIAIHSVLSVPLSNSVPIG
jgi:hypothetical protein